jgi:hypothetical protein
MATIDPSMAGRMNMRKLFGITLAMALLSGCQRGPQMCEVHGTVTYDGKPLEKGDIFLVASDGSVTPAAGRIEDGEFRIMSLPGVKRVEIRAVRENIRKKSAEGPPIFEDYLPECYNSNSTLRVEVAPAGENSFDFSLKSKP